MQLPEKTSTKQADLQVWAAIQSLTTIVEVPIFRQRMSVIGLSAGRQQTASTAHSSFTHESSSDPRSDAPCVS